jgi:hypothetical protein
MVHPGRTHFQTAEDTSNTLSTVSRWAAGFGSLLRATLRMLYYLHPEERGSCSGIGRYVRSVPQVCLHLHSTSSAGHSSHPVGCLPFTQVGEVAICIPGEVRGSRDNRVPFLFGTFSLLLCWLKTPPFSFLPRVPAPVSADTRTTTTLNTAADIRSHRRRILANVQRSASNVAPRCFMPVTAPAARTTA